MTPVTDFAHVPMLILLERANSLEEKANFKKPKNLLISGNLRPGGFWFPDLNGFLGFSVWVFCLAAACQVLPSLAARPAQAWAKGLG